MLVWILFEDEFPVCLLSTEKADQDPNHQLNQRQVIQQQFATFKPQTHQYTSPILRKGTLGNFEPKEPEPQGILNGPGEGAKPLILGSEYKESVQASIKEFGFNMVASDMISMDRTISDLRNDEWVCCLFILLTLVLS